MVIEPEKKINSIEELKALTNTTPLNRHPASRFAFAQNPDAALLFIDGKDYKVNPEFAKTLCKHRQINLDELIKTTGKNELSFIIKLYNQGKIYTE